MAMCRFALFDPARHSPDGSYWSWRAEGLDPRQLDRLYYEAAARHLPPDPNRLGPADIWGGMADLGSDVVGIYRCFDGGRDLHGRPGRFVILATLMAREDIVGKDVTAVLRSKAADWVSRRATECPVPEPPDLPEEIELPEAVGEEAPGGDSLDFTGPDAVERAGRVFGRLAAGEGWRCEIRQTADVPGHFRIYRASHLASPSPGIDEPPGKAEAPATVGAAGLSWDENSASVATGRTRPASQRRDRPSRIDARGRGTARTSLRLGENLLTVLVVPLAFIILILGPFRWLDDPPTSPPITNVPEPSAPKSLPIPRSPSVGRRRGRRSGFPHSPSDSIATTHGHPSSGKPRHRSRGVL